jgi:hypothetical protein
MKHGELTEGEIKDDSSVGELLGFGGSSFASTSTCFGWNGGGTDTLETRTGF